MDILVPLMIGLPAAGAVLLLILRSPDANVTRWGALLITAASAACSIAVAVQFFAIPSSAGDLSDPIATRWQLAHTWLDYGSSPWQGLRLEFLLGLDAISMSLVLLTSLLSVVSVLVSWRSIDKRVTEFFVCLLILQTGMLGVFCAFDLILFYVFFEFTLIPLFFLIGLWGGADRQRAAKRFFIYTLAGSFVTLVGLVWLVSLVIQRGTVNSPFSLIEIARSLRADPLPYMVQVGLFLTISTGLSVKVPLVPFHTWLPLAHVEAPTAGSVLLAGILLKLGTYGFLRICLPMFPEACQFVGVPLMGTLGVIGVIYGALGALAQTDIKRLVAYSSVSHLGFCMLGLFALNVQGITGGVMQMINHGLSTGGLFLIVGILYERYHTRQMSELSGLASRVPLIACSMVFICLSSIGLPGLNGFVGEFLSLAGMFKAQPIFAVVGTLGVVLGAWYLLALLQKAFFGPLREPHHIHQPIADMNWREGMLLAPILFFCLYLGVYPQPLLDEIRPDVERIVRVYESPTTLADAGPVTISE